MTLQSRVLREHRTLVLTVAVLAVLVGGLYVLVVYPLGLRLAAAEDRINEARIAEQRAEAEFKAAAALVTGKDKADEELRRFYRDVLPADLAGARRITYARLADLAATHDLDAGRRSFAPDELGNGPLRRLRITMSLEGDYEDIRRFVHQVETAPEFLVIEQMTLAEGTDPEAPLELALTLATYYYQPRSDGR